MKKTLAIILVLFTLLSVCGCKKGKADMLGLTPLPIATSVPTPFEEVTEEITEETNSEATELPEPTPTEEAKNEKKSMYVKGSVVNVREEASTSGKKITELAQNSQIEVISEKDGWSYIQYGQDKFGFMKNEYLSSNPVATATPSEAKPIPVSGTEQKKSNPNHTIDDNVFLDALEYTGYNLKKHREDGNMWVFILGKYKQGMGYLSGLGYDYGNTSGYETTSSGFPDIARIRKKGGFVCASYLTYVYFNYLPNVAGIDTSMLTKPASSVSAQSWRLAAEDWVKKGFSRKIPFKASRNSDGIIKFSADEEIPIGSIVIFKLADVPDSADARHVAIYAGKAGGYYWMTHVGNERGPEMVTMERMGFSSTAEIPLEIISAPLKFN